MGSLRALILLILLLASVSVAGGAEFSGNAVIYQGTSDNSGSTRTETLFQDYRVSVRLPITPLLTFRASFNFNELSNTPDVGNKFLRRNREPRFEIDYARNDLVVRLGYLDRRLSGSVDELELETTSLWGQVSFKHQKGVRFSFRFQDDSNVADLSVFGRDTDSTILDLSTSFVRNDYTLFYSMQDLGVVNHSTGLRVDQQRHTLRGTYSARWLDDRLSFSLDARLIRDQQSETTPAGTVIPELVPAVEGLAIVDTSPELGEMNPVEGLNDGDFSNPARPGLDIGGANLFRNIGLDLGFSLSVTRLELTVDTLSDPGLLFAVYHGPDNLNWNQVALLRSTFDPLLLRYTLEFPETTDRYFKLVNLSNNSQPEVLVTELRALVDLLQEERSARSGTHVRGFAQMRYQPQDRFLATLSIGASDVSSSGDSLLQRRSKDLSFRNTLSWEMAPNLRLRTILAHAEIERELEQQERRKSDRAEVALVWDPIPTVNGELSVQQRTESDDRKTLRETRLLRARASTEILPDLRVISELSIQDVDDSFSAFVLDSFTWRETFDARMNDRVHLTAELARVWYDSKGSVSLTGRRSVGLGLRVILPARVSLSAQVDYADENERNTVSQRYNISWSPGIRLSLSGSYSATRSETSTQTSFVGANLNYRFNKHMSVFGTLSRSRSQLPGVLETTITTGQTGLRLTF